MSILIGILIFCTIIFAYIMGYKDGAKKGLRTGYQSSLDLIDKYGLERYKSVMWAYLRSKEVEDVSK